MLVIYLLIVVFAGGGMIISTINTQVVHGEMWRDNAEQYERTTRSEEARRGTIYSSDGKVMATTIPVCDLCLDLRHDPMLNSKGEVIYDSKTGRPRLVGGVTDPEAFMAGLDTVCQLLHQYFPNKSPEYYHDRIMEGYNHTPTAVCLYVQREVPYSVWEQIRKVKGWDRCIVRKTAEGSVINNKRNYIYDNLGISTIGTHFKTKYRQGYTGLEGYYDSILRGHDGLYRCRRLTQGIWIPIDDDNIREGDSVIVVQPRIDGKDIVATLDTRYQDIADNALRQSMDQYGGHDGCAILMEIETGYILACCNLHRDTTGRLCENIWKNVACSDIYEPGSTFKTVAMLAMMNDKAIGLDTSKRVRAGGDKAYSHTSGVIHDHGKATDTANLAGVLARSSNIGMCELSWEYYRNRRNDLRRGIEAIFPFDLVRPDLQVELHTSGFGRRADSNYLRPDRTFLCMSFGHACTVTPLQLITFYNAIAGGGRMVKPLFCREIRDQEKGRAIKPVVLNDHICSAETAKQMREMLISVVMEGGTAHRIFSTEYGIGGKTGTAEHHDNRSVNNSSFVGFFPAEHPRYTCLVMIEGTGRDGSRAAAPVFKRIADCVVAFDEQLGSIRMQDDILPGQPVVVKGKREQTERIHKLLGIPFAVTETPPSTLWTTYDSEEEIYIDYMPPAAGTVPDCRGMTVRDAMALLRSEGYQVRFTGQGKVVKQQPAPRSAAQRGSTIILELTP